MKSHAPVVQVDMSGIDTSHLTDDLLLDMANALEARAIMQMAARVPAEVVVANTLVSAVNYTGLPVFERVVASYYATKVDTTNEHDTLLKAITNSCLTTGIYGKVYSFPHDGEVEARLSAAIDSITGVSGLYGRDGSALADEQSALLMFTVDSPSKMLVIRSPEAIEVAELLLTVVSNIAQLNEAVPAGGQRKQ